MPSEPLEAYARQLAAAGGSCEVLAPGATLNEIRSALPVAEARHLYSAVDGLESRGLGAADPTRTAPSDLTELDVSVVEGAFAVVENGAVWQAPKTDRCRAAMLLAEHLVLVVSLHEFVPSLHQAYERIEAAQREGLRFGWFVAGPSKTADIEQALVLGAHGPRTMHVVFRATGTGATHPA